MVLSQTGWSGDGLQFICSCGCNHPCLPELTKVLFGVEGDIINKMSEFSVRVF